MQNNTNDRLADLHIHTTFSDGLLRPEDVVNKAIELGLRAIAITDHDCIDGVSLAIEAAHSSSLEIVPGIELSAFIEDREAHLLGYYIDIENPSLIIFLDKLKQGRMNRALEMISLLKDKGMDLDQKIFASEKDKGTIGRMNLARALFNNGFVGSVKEAFDRFIGNGKSCCVQNSKLSYIDGIDLILSSGGVPVLAHPGTIGDSSYIYKCISAGLKGLEVYHPRHKPHEVLEYEDIASKNGLIVTGGSDCHGMPLRNKLLLGTVTVNYETVKALKNESGIQNG